LHYRKYNDAALHGVAVSVGSDVLVRNLVLSRVLET